MSRLSKRVREAAHDVTQDEERHGALYDRRVYEWDDTPLKAASTNTGAPTGISDPTGTAALNTRREKVGASRHTAMKRFIEAADNLLNANKHLATATNDPIVELICDNPACVEPVFVRTSQTGPNTAKPLCDGCSMSIKRSGQLPGPDQISERTRKRNQRKGNQQ